MISSRRSSAAVCGSFRIPRSSTMRSGTVARSKSRSSGAVDRGFGELFEQHVSFAIDHAIALLDGGATDGLGEMTLAGPRRAEEERVLACIGKNTLLAIENMENDSAGADDAFHTQ